MHIVVVGSGISGLAAAWLLARKHDVELIESEPRLGGHTHTVHVDGMAIDTGFIVYNETTYPLLTRLFDELDVQTQPSDMSWSVQCARCALEYAGSATGMFAQPQRIVDRRHLTMVGDIMRFHRLGRNIVAHEENETLTLGEFVRTHGFSDAFRDHYLFPMASAIWSSGMVDTEAFPATTLLRFFANHGLLTSSGHLKWRTVTNGAVSYVERLAVALEGRIRTASPVAAVQRDVDGVNIRLADGTTQRADHVVLACHADTALDLLVDATPAEKEALGVWRYSDNDALLHTDSTFLPTRRAAQASWNYRLEDCTRPVERVSLSYGMNRLQSLDTDVDYIVTLNADHEPHPAHVRKRMRYRHPIFSQDAVDSQALFADLNTANRTSFAGAYQRHGFHEDGLWSAVRVARELGVSWPE